MNQLHLPTSVVNVASVCGKEDVRYPLTGVQLEWDKDGNACVVATDTRRLMVARFGDITATDQPGSALIDGKEFKDIGKMAGKLPNLILETDTLNGHATFYAGVKSAKVLTNERRYPSWREVMPTYHPPMPCPGNSHAAATIKVDGKLLAELIQGMLKTVDGGDDHRTITLSVPLNSTGPVLIQADGDKVSATGVLMPLSK